MHASTGQPWPAEGLTRQRLLDLIDLARPPTPAFVVGPAGSGKTTLMAQYAARHDGPVAWYPADRVDVGPAAVVRRVAAAVRAAVGRPDDGDDRLDRLVADIEAAGAPVLLVIDNFCHLVGTAVEELMERIAVAGPPELRVLVGGRRMPEVPGMSVVDADALRFRAGEVDRLLREVDGRTVPTAEVVELTRRTGGWAAALAACRLAARGSYDLGEYLDGVVAAVPAGGRDFLIRTSVLETLTGPRCDALLGRRDSAALLAGLARAGVVPLTAEAGGYRYPDLLRRRLHGLLLDGWGAAAARDLQRRAGDLLAAEGERAEAVRAHARAAAIGPVRGGPRPAGGPAIEVRCFGGFRIEADGRPVDLAGVRPRARTILRLLALRVGQPVHREVLAEALWPDLPPAAAARNLQLEVSGLCRLLRPHARVTHAGDGYALALPPGGRVDVPAFEAAVKRWRSARNGAAGGGGDARAAAALRAALVLYRGELLPEDGPAEWVVEERERYRRLAASAASALADIELTAGDAGAAEAAAEQCVAIDPYHDTGWRQLLRAYELGGDLAAAAAARRRYADVLASLGVPAALVPQPPMMTVGAPAMIGAPQPVMSPTRAAG